MKKRPKILVVDDEEDLCEILQFNFRQAGFDVEIALSAEEALMMNITSCDLILLDVMMGEMSGFKMADIVRKNHKTAHIPIIFCTAKDAEEDTLLGLEIGGDDYILKPFSVKEVIARVKAVLRRTSNPAVYKPVEINSFAISAGEISIDMDSKKVMVDEREVELTKTEFEIITLLLKNTNKVISREEIIGYVWKDEVFINDRTVDVHITRLRKKIAPYGKNIVSRSGYGYCYEYK
ncbi:response regulator transcription factor [Bacteroidales bacterium OttesenSCG-928-B11]|nr:response regulator transcription factor [Bacteroidales bacterium OttesenSCG-928-E04]MDL2312600.1 response regulator transcription factor [Bacteroidales bacterium OttesenSCG-928-B11]